MIKAAIGLIGLALADVGTTEFALQHGAHEVNPFMAAIVENPFCHAIFKVSVFLGVIHLVYFLYLRGYISNKHVKIAIGLLFVEYAFVVLWNLHDIVSGAIAAGVI